MLRIDRSWNGKNVMLCYASRSHHERTKLREKMPLFHLDRNVRQRASCRINFSTHR